MLSNLRRTPAAVTSGGTDAGAGTGAVAELSIVVPTRNEERNLPRLLASIRRQSSAPCDIVVVDQCSADSTCDIARSFGCDVVHVPATGFYSPPARSRNAGAGVAGGRYILHLDADMELPDAGFLERLMALFDDGHQSVVVHERDVATGFWSRAKAIERLSYWGSPVEAARACTRELFTEVGGYDESISSGEDFWIADRYAQHTEVASADDVWILHHTGRTPLRRLLRKKFDYGRTARTYLDRGRATERGRPLSYVVTCLRAYGRRPEALLRDPLHFGGMLLLRALELTAVGTGMAVERLTAGRSGRRPPAAGAGAAADEDRAT